MLNILRVFRIKRVVRNYFHNIKLHNSRKTLVRNFWFQYLDTQERKSACMRQHFQTESKLMLLYLHTHSRTNTFIRTMKITWQSWASIKNVCVVLLLERTHTIKHGRTTTIYFWYTLHSSNKNYKFPSSFSLLLFIPHFFSPWPNSFIFTPNAYNCSPIHSNFYYLWSILLI